MARQGWAVRTLRKHRRDACATDLKDFSKQFLMGLRPTRKA